MINEPNTVPIPAPDPATPTVAAPAPMNLAAESMSLVTEVVWKERTADSCVGGAATICVCVGTAASGLTNAVLLKMADLAAGAISLAADSILLILVRRATTGIN